MSVHGILKNTFVSNMFESDSITVPWLGEDPLGFWDKDGERMVEFSILANLVTGGGVHIGAGKARTLGITGKNSIVPLKESGKINVETGARYSAWKYVKSVAFTGSFNEAEGPDRYQEIIEKMDLDVSDFDNNLELFNHLYFHYMNKMGCDKPLKLESFIAEVATAYKMLSYGHRVPEEYMPKQRLTDWASIMRGGDDKVLTMIGTRAQSLIR